MSISGWAGEQVSIDGRAASATVSRGRPKHFPVKAALKLKCLLVPACQRRPDRFDDLDARPT